MSQVTFCRCDGCGKTVENGAAELGWVKLGGTVSRSRGVYDRGSWRSAFIDKQTDFCGLDCLRAALDRQDEKDAAEDAARRLSEPSKLTPQDVAETTAQLFPRSPISQLLDPRKTGGNT